jgi:hypothetical protein
MSARSVEIPGCAEFPEFGVEAFAVDDELTIFEAAMVYCGRNPGGRFIEGGSLREHEGFLGRGSDEMPYKISWDVWRDLCERVDQGKLEPVRKHYSSDGNLDPRLTVIRTVDLANLAKDRGDSSFDFSSWMPASTAEIDQRDDAELPLRP